MIYEPDDDPFLDNEGASEADSPPFRSSLPRRGRNLNQQSPNYQYQQQSMYQIPVGPGLPPPAYAMAQPGQIAQNPSFMMMPPQQPPGPMMRPVPSFYSDPGSQYSAGPIGPPYGMPPPYYPPAAAGFAGAAPYRDRTSLTDQIEELERYERTRPPQYNSSAADNSLLIATLVSEQDALYGTNMLENITAMDQEYIQGLMARGVPEHEALRMAFDRKPHSVIPPRVVSTTVDTPADMQALETAIQLSLTESSRRASQPDTSSGGGLSPTSAERADREALETAIQLSLSEQESHRQHLQQQYHSSGSGYSDYQQQQQQERYTLSRDDASVRSSGDYSYYSETSRDRPRYLDTTDQQLPSFDRQYPYNLSREAPQEALSRDYAISSVDKYRQAQKQQQQYFDHLQQYEDSDHHHLRHSHDHLSHHFEEEEDYRSQQQMPLSAREAEELRARAYGGRNPTTAPPPYAHSRSRTPSPPTYPSDYTGDYGGHHYERHAPPPAYGETADDYSEGSRSRSDSGGYGPHDAPPPSYAHHPHHTPHGPPVAYGAPGPQYISPPYSYDDDDYSDEGKVDPPVYGRGPVPAPPRYAPPPQSVRSGYSAGGGTTTEYSDSDGISYNRAPSSRDLRAPLGSERSYSPQAGLTMQPPEQDRQYLERERLHQQHVISTSQQQSRTVTQQYQQLHSSGSHTEYTNANRPLPTRPPPPQFSSAATRGIAVTTSSNDLHRAPSPSELSTETGEDGIRRPKHEWRKTLTRLVSKLTVDSDDDEEPSPV